MGEPPFLSEVLALGGCLFLCRTGFLKLFFCSLQRKWAGLSIGQEIDGEFSTVLTVSNSWICVSILK